MIVAALQLNLPIKPIIKKIPLSSIKQTIC